MVTAAEGRGPVPGAKALPRLRRNRHRRPAPADHAVFTWRTDDLYCCSVLAIQMHSRERARKQRQLRGEGGVGDRDGDAAASEQGQAVAGKEIPQAR